MIEIENGLFYCEKTGKPYSNRSGTLKCLHYNGKINKYITVWCSKRKHSYYWHRIVWEHYNGSIPKDMEVDHISNNPRDNRISNLRLVSHGQNIQRKRKQKNNTSGYAGVKWDNDRKKWAVGSSIKGKSINLGRYDDIEDARKAYEKFKSKCHFT